MKTNLIFGNSPNKIYNIGHTIPKTYPGGLNLILVPDLLILHFIICLQIAL